MYEGILLCLPSLDTMDLGIRTIPRKPEIRTEDRDVFVVQMQLEIQTTAKVFVGTTKGCKRKIWISLSEEVEFFFWNVLQLPEASDVKAKKPTPVKVDSIEKNNFRSKDTCQHQNYHVWWVSVRPEENKSCTFCECVIEEITKILSV